MVLRRLTLTVAFAGCLAAGPGFACDAFEGFGQASGTVRQDGYEVRYRFDPPTLAPFAPFDVDLAVCGPDGGFDGELNADADMPAHRHGMNYRPGVEMSAPGRYRAEGFLFHMPGDWRFKFDLRTAEGPVRLRAVHIAQ